MESPSRRRLLGASLLPLAATACAVGGFGSRPPPLPAGLVEGSQRPWLLTGDTAAANAPDAPYRRMHMAIPAGYVESTRKWPLMIFMHGAGERGDDLEDVKRNGPPMLAARGTAYPMIVCSPQVDPQNRWEPERLHRLVAELEQRFAIDRKRVYATGLSMGGGGCWRWACAYPSDLAAIAPICGGGDPTAVQAMRRVPVRAYHGDDDPFVPLLRQQVCVDELNRLGGKASLTIYKGVGHDSWTPAYEDPGLVPWLLQA